MYRTQFKYRWPASKIDRDIMAELKKTSVATGLPITEILADAVHRVMTERLEQQQAPIGFSTAGKPPQQAAG